MCYNAHMLIISSSAKTLDESSPLPKVQTRQPVFLKQAEQLHRELAELSLPKLQKVLHCNEKIAELNFKRMQDWSRAEERPALFMYHGDVYRELDPQSYSIEQINYAADHVFAMSGLYGVLGGLDQFKPYRLEMNAKLPGHKLRMNEYWQEPVTDYFNQLVDEKGHKCLLNLASVEYAKAVDPSRLKVPIIDVDFKEERDGDHKTIGIFAKRARGMMIHFCIENQVEDPKELQNFKAAGYSFAGEEGGRLQFYR